MHMESRYSTLSHAVAVGAFRDGLFTRSLVVRAGACWANLLLASHAAAVEIEAAFALLNLGRALLRLRGPGVAKDSEGLDRFGEGDDPGGLKVAVGGLPREYAPYRSLACLTRKIFTGES